MNFRSAETNIPLSVGWLVRKMIYSSGEEQWELKDNESVGEEEYHAASGQFHPSQVKRIVFAEVV